MSWAGTFAHGVAISIDMACELVIFWRRGEPMTISSRCGLALRKGQRWTLGALVGRLLNFISTGHCEGAIAADIERCTLALQELNVK